MAWFKKQKTTEPEPPKRSKISEGMWLKCNHCREIIYRKEVERNNKVCPKCDYHFPISVMERIALLVTILHSLSLETANRCSAFVPVPQM